MFYDRRDEVIVRKLLEIEVGVEELSARLSAVERELKRMIEILNGMREKGKNATL